jgi:hypothetical protein
MSNKPKKVYKWPEQMKNDVLKCKRKANHLTSSQNDEHHVMKTAGRRAILK